MKTTLVFFDDISESKKGLLRGLVCITVLILLDLCWFQIMDYDSIITRKKINLLAAFVAYLLMCSGLSVQLPNSLKEAITYGMLFAVVVYGVYNGTNYATKSEWTMKVAILDTLWGMTNCSIACTVLYFIFHKNNKY
jgi:uncharacterized membrane protein